MNLRNKPSLQDKLAAEYVLGTLRGPARRRFEKWVSTDPALRRTVIGWQDRLHALAELAPASKPSLQVWQSIESRLELRSRTGTSSFWSRLYGNTSFWRGLSIASVMVATVLTTFLLVQQPDISPRAVSNVAMLVDAKGQPVVIVTGDSLRRELLVKVTMEQPVGPERSLQLWAVPQQGTPRSLGLLAAGESVSLPLPENVTPDSAPVLAVSLEPAGGSPKADGPSGPILFSGRWLRI